MFNKLQELDIAPLVPITYSKASSSTVGSVGRTYNTNCEVGTEEVLVSEVAGLQELTSESCLISDYLFNYQT